MSYALLFSGQGTQHAQMLPWLDGVPAVQEALDGLARALGGPWRSRLEGSACRSSNAIAQPLIVGTALAAWQALQGLLPQPPQAVAGYSVGELAAFAAAGAYAPAEALALAQQRAQLMDCAVAGHNTGLLAIAAITEAEVLAACPELECAIRIASDSNVFGGAGAALMQAERTLKRRARFKRIRVKLASHTSWMRRASHAFAQHVDAVGVRAPQCPVALNASGRTTRDARALASGLAAQVAQTVQWGSCMAAIAERRPACVLEIGGGQALARMWTARHAPIPARSLDEFESVEAAADWLRRHL